MIDKFTLSAKQYFAVVGIFTFSCIGLWLSKNTELKQIVKEELGLANKLQASDDSFYNNRIQHIFETYCIGCHDDNKAKGNLRLDSFRQTMFGGKSGDIVAGGENSLLLQRMLLPAENRLAMPPYGRDRQTTDELEVLKQWLELGASGQLTAESFPHAPQKAREITFSEIDWHHIELAREPLAQSVQALQKQYPSSLSYLARTSADLALSGVILREKLTNQVLAEFGSIAEGIAAVDLRNTAVTDSGMPILATMEKLSVVNLVDTEITAKGMAYIAELPALEKLVVQKQAITRQQLEKLQASGTQVVVVEKSS